jgi:hypothetical protein
MGAGLAGGGGQHAELEGVLGWRDGNPPVVDNIITHIY